MKLKALVIGLGQIGMGYDIDRDEDNVLTHARAFSQHPGFNLVGAVDPSPERCSLFESIYGGAAYTNIKSALDDISPEVVAIATPTHLHFEVLNTVLKLSAPVAILSEKPLSYDLEEASAMFELCANQRCKLYVNYIRRSDPGAIEIGRRLSHGLIDGPVRGVAWYSKGLFNNGSHLLNLLQFWLGDVQNFSVIGRGRMWNDFDPEPDVKVEFSHGEVVFLAAKEENFSHYTVELVASNGRLRYEQGGKKIRWEKATRSPNLANYTVLTKRAEVIPTGMKRYQWHVVDQLAKNLEGLPASICSGSEALLTVNVLSKIRSML